jgi:hypothetical protein
VLISVSYLALVGRRHNTTILFVCGHYNRRQIEEFEGDDVAGESCQRQASKEMNYHFSCPRFVFGCEGDGTPISFERKAFAGMLVIDGNDGSFAVVRRTQFMWE